MHDATVLHISRDPKLCRSVEETAGSVSHPRLATVPAFKGAGALGQPDSPLICHVPFSAACDSVYFGRSRLFQKQSAPAPSLGAVAAGVRDGGVGAAPGRG